MQHYLANILGWEVSKLAFTEVRRGVFWPRDWDSINLRGRTPYAPDAEEYTPRSKRRESLKPSTSSTPPASTLGVIGVSGPLAHSTDRARTAQRIRRPDPHCRTALVNYMHGIRHRATT